MKNIFISTILILFTVNLFSQTSCQEIMEVVEQEGIEQASYCCFDSDFLTGVKFYDLTIDYNTYSFALVQFEFGSWYIYRVPSNSQFNFSLYAYGDQAGEAFHEYIHAYKDNLDCY